MKFSGKMCLRIILKVTENQGFTLSLENTFFEKPQGGQIDPSPPAVLGLKNMASSEGISYLQEFFMLLWVNRGWYTSNCKELELEVNFHVSRILFQKDSSHKYSL